MQAIPINNSFLLQSPYLYCQAVGSTANDRSKQGAHVRWDLTQELGENHIPKGNLAGTSENFNKPDDYVTLYRALFAEDNHWHISLENIDDNQISYLPNSGGIVYHVPVIGVNFIVRFLNRSLFSMILAQGLDPNNKVQDFLNRYRGIIEVEVENQLMIKYRFNYTAPSTATGGATIETVSTTDRFDNNAVRVTKREHKAGDELLANGLETIGENIKYFRIDQDGMPAPQSITFFTYENVFNIAQLLQDWDYLGQFSLTLDENEAFTRFQGAPYSGTPELTWLKYNQPSELRPENYLDRWNNGPDNMISTIQQYVALSDSDPRAMVNLTADPNDPNTITVSMLDMMKLMALDYHAARLMGLGYLDDFPAQSDQQYIYAAVYTTQFRLPNAEHPTDHVFISLPTSKNDNRWPAPPILELVTYGLYVSTDDYSPPELISDPNGYSFFDDTRYVNLHKQNQVAPQPVLPVMGSDYFDCSTVTQPVGFGIEYKRPDDPEWITPELLYDDEYTNTDGQPEPVTAPETESNPIYTHRETESGIREYALYAVNWFSRASELSNSVVTDETIFGKKNTLLPPLNFSVQYIQEEDPRIFTTQAEQDELTEANNSNPNGDNYKTRVTFDWNNLHNNAYRVADKIEFFYRDTPIKKIEGKILYVNSISETECQVGTGPFTIASVNPPMVISPVISPAEQSLFVGSLLCTPDGQFAITAVLASSPGPIFTVKKLVATETSQATPDDPVVTIPVYTPPDHDSIFYVFENVSLVNNWAKLNKTVNIVNLSDTIEDIEEEDGSTHVEVVGGINGDALIEPIMDVTVTPNLPTGGYRVSFNTGTDLPSTGDNAVSWIRGSARFIIHNTPTKKKVLPVVAIEESMPIRIVVFDPDYANVDERIRTGSNIAVNFHPGYKVYLSPEPGVFDKTKTMPVGTANNKKTYLAARSADTSIPLYSSLTQPAVLVARNVQKPLAPESAVGPTFATRPDFYGKSTYTLDITLNISGRTPFGVVVYRASEMSILQTLYKPDTLQQVITDLAAIENDDPLRFNRWRSLVEVETDPGNNNQFRLFGSYRFPNPDNNSTIIFPVSADESIRPFPLQGGETILGRKTIIKKAIEDIFVPLTETPVIFEYLKTGYQTSSEEPRTKSIIGRLLSPADPAFNPFPMAVKFPAVNPNTVRFTDYTLSGNSRNIYFYFAREISVNAKLSARTPASGPVVLVDAAPAEKPTIRKIITQEENISPEKPAAIVFELAEYIKAEKITQYQVFRTTDFASAATVRTMQLANTIDVGEEVHDDFNNLSFPPFGQPLFYRIVALREIINEKNETEMIPSQPSELVYTNIIDVINPVAPEITADIGSQQTSGGQLLALLNVTLSWPQTVYNGTYHLYKMNIRGNWEKLWSKKTNAAEIEFPENGDFVTWPQTANLPKLDADGNVIYHRFKVSVENASGLFSTHDRELVI